MADERNDGDAVENDPTTDVHVEQRTADSRDDLNIDDQATPEGALLVPGGGHEDDRTELARAFVLAGDVADDPTPQTDGAVVVSTLVKTDRVTASGAPVYEVRPERRED